MRIVLLFIRMFLLACIWWLTATAVVASKPLTTSLGYSYKQEDIIPIQYKILIFSYGTLVTQKDNKQTGDVLLAEPFQKTSIDVPVSYTFLAGFPKKLCKIHTRPSYSDRFENRRATVTVDSHSQEFKTLWSAKSKFNSIKNARNNLAAREGSPLISAHVGYDLSSIFYIRKISDWDPKNSNEEYIENYPEWVVLKGKHKHQNLNPKILQQMIEYALANNAQAILWAALPSNVTSQKLQELLKDKAFIKNTYNYISKLPKGHNLTAFEQKVIKLYNANK